MSNKYRSFFKKGMSSMDAMSVYFSLLTKDMTKKDRELLWEAYGPIQKEAIFRELKLSREKELMM